MTYQNHEHFLHRRKEVEAHIHELIALLDLIDEDPDIEPAGDDEPELGWTDRGPAALMQFTDHDDRENDGADLEPSLGGVGKLCCVTGEVLYDLEEDRCDDELNGDEHDTSFTCDEPVPSMWRDEDAGRLAREAEREAWAIRDCAGRGVRDQENLVLLGSGVAMISCR